MDDNNLIKVELNKLTPKLLAGSQSREIGRLVRQAILQGKNYVLVNKATYEVALSKAASQQKKEADFATVTKQRAIARKKEVEGNLTEAIRIYEDNLSIGQGSLSIQSFAFDIDRLLILYRKTNQTTKELTLLRESIAKYPAFSGVNKWKERLSKLN